MRRVGVASLTTVNPLARPARDPAAKDGDVTEMFAEKIEVPSCVVPAAAAPAPGPAETDPSPAARPSEPEPARPTWHERMTRAIAARFQRGPRPDESDAAKERLERFRTRRAGPDPSN
jgi:hypothetical protein